MVKFLKKTAFFIFILFVLGICSCSIDWFSSYNEIVEEETSTEYIFYSEEPVDMTTVKSCKIKYSVGQVVNQTSLPDTSNPEIAKMKPGYEIAGWKSTSDSTLSNVVTDSLGYVTGFTVIKATLCFYATWIVSSNTKYVVNHYWQNIEDDNYQLHETVKMYGTTFEQTAAVPIDYTGFTLNGTVTQVEIAADGSSVVDIYYDRKKVNVVLNASPGKFEDGNSTVTLNGKYGASVVIPSVTYDGYSIDFWSPEVPGTFPAEDLECTASWQRESGTTGFQVTLPAYDEKEVTLSINKIEGKKFQVAVSLPAGMTSDSITKVTGVLEGNPVYSGTALSFQVDYSNLPYGTREFMVIVESGGNYYSATATIKLSYEEM